MLDFAIAALKLAGPLSQLVSNSGHGDRVATELDEIAESARTLAKLLQDGAGADVDELMGRMRHFPGQIERTLCVVISEDAPRDKVVTTTVDMNTFVKQLGGIVEQLNSFDSEVADARERKQLVRGLKMFSGQLAAQASEIRKGSAGPTLGSYVEPVITGLTAAGAASWAAVVAVSEVSFQTVEDNYDIAKDAVMKLAWWKSKDDDGPDDVA